MDFKNIVWNEDTYNKYYKELFNHIDEKFKEEKNFERHRKIINVPKEQMIGLKIFEIKKIAKEISKGDWKSFFILKNKNTYEEKLIKGLVLCYVKEDFYELKNYLEYFFENDVDNWAICDGFITNFKIIKKEKIKYLKLIRKYSKDKNPWKIRILLVSLLSYYMENEDMEEVIKICKEVKNDEYYVKMGLAWLISVMFVKERDITLKFMEEDRKKLDVWTYNKSIQKIIESFRVSEEDKKLVRTMKIK